MATARRVLALLLAVLAVLSAVVVVSAVYGVAEEYGAGPGSDALALAIVPVALGAGAAATRGTTGGVVGALVFTVLVVVGGLVAGPLGQAAKDRAAVEADATFACNGPASEFLVPDEVDEGWDDFAHPFHLYGPVGQSRYGCTAAVDGPVADTWGPWRRSLLDAGWRVVRDDSRVAVTDGALRATLSERDDLAFLTLETVVGHECRFRDHRRPDPDPAARC